MQVTKNYSVRVLLKNGLLLRIPLILTLHVYIANGSQAKIIGDDQLGWVLGHGNRRAASIALDGRTAVAWNMRLVCLSERDLCGPGHRLAQGDRFIALFEKDIFLDADFRWGRHRIGTLRSR